MLMMVKQVCQAALVAMGIIGISAIAMSYLQR